MIDKSFLRKIDEDDWYVSYRPTVPISIFGFKLKSAYWTIAVSPQVDMDELIPALSTYLEWLAACREEVTEYFSSKLQETLPENWYETNQVYSAEITFTTLEDFGVIVSFSESIIPDHVVEFTIKQYQIVNDALLG